MGREARPLGSAAVTSGTVLSGPHLQISPENAVFTRVFGVFSMPGCVCAAAVDAAVLGRFWASWAQKRTPTAADAPDLKLFVKSGPFPPEMFRFPVETTAFPDVSRDIPSFPAFLNYVVPVHFPFPRQRPAAFFAVSINPAA